MTPKPRQSTLFHPINNKCGVINQKKITTCLMSKVLLFLGFHYNLLILAESILEQEEVIQTLSDENSHMDLVLRRILSFVMCLMAFTYILLAKQFALEEDFTNIYNGIWLLITAMVNWNPTYANLVFIKQTWLFLSPCLGLLILTYSNTAFHLLLAWIPAIVILSVVTFVNRDMVKTSEQISQLATFKYHLKGA